MSGLSNCNVVNACNGSCLDINTNCNVVNVGSEKIP